MVISFSAVCFMAFGVQQGRERNLLFMLGMWFSNACKFLSYIWFPLESLIALLFAANYFPCQILPSELWLKKYNFQKKSQENISVCEKLIYYPAFFFPILKNYFLKEKRLFSGCNCRQLRSAWRILWECKVSYSPGSSCCCIIGFRTKRA